MAYRFNDPNALKFVNGKLVLSLSFDQGLSEGSVTIDARNGANVPIWSRTIPVSSYGPAVIDTKISPSGATQAVATAFAGGGSLGSRHT